MILAGILAAVLMDVRGGAAADYHVDFERGDDARDGLAPERAWRHAPGDTNARARPAATTLRPGDRLLFAAGVRYRGAIRLNGSGRDGQPVTITSGPGAGAAIIDGSDPPAGQRPCRSADDCGGSPIWQKLVRVQFDAPLPANAALFTETGLLFPAQSPVPSDPFNADDTAEYLAGDPADAQGGTIRLPIALAHTLTASGVRQLVLQLYANEIALRPIIAIDDGMARFDPTGLRFNTDRPVRFAVQSHPLLVARPGDFGVLADRSAAVVYLPPGGKSVSVAAGRSGIDLSGQSHVTISGLAFENMADDGAGPFSGVAIFKSSPGTDILIEKNRFEHFRLLKGNGPLALNLVKRPTVRGNDIQSVAFGSGMRFYRNTDLTITGNTIRRIGRTGIMLIDVEGALVAQNVIAHARGIHGNGISAYRANKDVRFVANTIVDALRPVTFHGSAGVENRLAFERNMVIGTADSLGALTSWGQTTGVSISGNLLIGGTSGLDLSATDTSVAVGGNVMNGSVTVKHSPPRKENAPGYIPADWTIGSNRRINYSLERRSSIEPGVASAIADALDHGRSGAWRRLCELIPNTPPDGVGGRRIGARLDCAAAQ